MFGIIAIFYSICRRAASRRAGLLLAAALCACAPAAGSSFRPAGTAPPAPAITPAVTPSPALPNAALPTAAAPSVPTVPLPDPDRTAWPGPINRFQQEAVLADAGLSGPLIAFHLNRSDVDFRVAYSPGAPRYLTQWAFELSRGGEVPLLIFPAGFFSEDYYAQGLLVADGVLYGEAHGIGGVFVVQGGQPDIRWLRPQPIRPAEEFEQAVQAFPIYFHRGRLIPVNEHVARAPRTVLVETRSGDFVVLFSLTNLFRTTDMPQWLMDWDMDVYNALNLDGGRSAGYWAGDDDYADSFVPLPAVIAVFRK